MRPMAKSQLEYFSTFCSSPCLLAFLIYGNESRLVRVPSRISVKRGGRGNQCRAESLGYSKMGSSRKKGRDGGGLLAENRRKGAGERQGRFLFGRKEVERS